jgi:hypothetical protein
MLLVCSEESEALQWLLGDASAKRP